MTSMVCDGQHGITCTNPGQSESNIWQIPWSSLMTEEKRRHTGSGLDVRAHRAAGLYSLAEGHHALPAAKLHCSDVGQHVWHAWPWCDLKTCSSHSLGHQPAALEGLPHHLRCQEQTCKGQHGLSNCATYKHI